MAKKHCRRRDYKIDIKNKPLVICYYNLLKAILVIRPLKSNFGGTTGITYLFSNVQDLIDNRPVRTYQIANLSTLHPGYLKIPRALRQKLLWAFTSYYKC